MKSSRQEGRQAGERGNMQASAAAGVNFKKPPHYSVKFVKPPGLFSKSQKSTDIASVVAMYTDCCF
jgi:hypothetical protein